MGFIEFRQETTHKNVRRAEKVRVLVREWGECIADDGYFFFSARPNAPHYIFDKMVGGLVDAWVHCRIEEALQFLDRITTWACEHLARTRRFAFTEFMGDTEWYTLTENLVRASIATGSSRYRDFAQVWAYDDYWNLYPAGGELFVPKTGVSAYHAYSHVNTLGGAGALYRVTGDQRYLEILRSAHDVLTSDHTFATGGFGPDEQLLPPSQLPGRLAATHHSFETQCGSFAVLKLVKYLMRFTGEARYGDWAERILINALLASQETADDGRAFYYSDYCLEGGTKFRHDTAWTCCTGTRPMAVADVCDLIWFKDEDGLYVNLFVPSTVEWSRGGSRITVEQCTRFPESEKVSLKIRTTAPAEFSVRVRMPGWIAGEMRWELNGEDIKPTAQRRGWTEYRRTWRDEDQLSITLPGGLWRLPLRMGHEFPAALAYGPVVLAIRAQEVNPHAFPDLATIEEMLEPVDGEPLTFRWRTDPSVLVRPFRDFREGERYFMYLDPAMKDRIFRHQMSFAGPWSIGAQFHYTNAIGATAECTFTGSGLRWLGYRFDDAGRARISIDGETVAIVDQYGPGRGLDFDWLQKGLPDGPHHLRLEVLPEKSEASSGHYLNVAGFEVLGR